MLDNPEKTTKLLTALKAAAPFEVDLTEWLVKELRRQHDAVADSSHHTVPTSHMPATKVASCAISFRQKNEKRSLYP